MRVGVIGGDVAGLVAACVLKGHGHRVTVFEPDGVGRSYALPTFKYLERTSEVLGLLKGLDLPHGEYPIQGGLLVNGKVVGCRKHLLSDVERAKRIHFNYYRKTRLVMPASFNVKSIDDPEVGPMRHAVSCDYFELIRALVAGVKVVRQRVLFADPIRIETKEATYPFDRIVVCAPLWTMQNVLPSVDIPEAMAVKVHVVQVDSAKDRYLKWDFVYTPYTPGQLIYRLYNNDDGYACQFSGELDEDRLQSDLNFLFPDGWSVTEESVTVPGHLLPLAESVEWPTGIVPVGKYARWDNKATVTTTIQDINRMARLWHGKA